MAAVTSFFLIVYACKNYGFCYESDFASEIVLLHSVAGTASLLPAVRNISLLLRHRLEFITDPPDRCDLPGVVILDLFPQSFDMYVYRTGIAGIFISPDLV